MLAEAPHWDEVTRRVVLARLEPPAPRCFTAAEADTLRAFCDTVMAQDGDPRIPVLELVDAKLFEGRGVGYRHAGMPSDREVWRRVASGLAEHDLATAPGDRRLEIVGAFARGAIEAQALAGLDVALAWATVMRDVLEAFYSHPWAWNEMGFGGPAYPRGYARMGPGQREPWEAPEAFSVDPVRDVRERGLDR